MTDNSLLAQYDGARCIVTGGASFIGSHLVERLIHLGSSVTIIDDFSSGRLSNLSNVSGNSHVRIIEEDLRALPENSDLSSLDGDILFHLAAIHGGRGYIDTYKTLMLENLAIDANVFKRSQGSVARVVHASSACVYPLRLQTSTLDRELLAEDLAGFDAPEQSFPDGVYGWVKLMGELQAKVTAESGAFSARSARIFTAYGERENESHAAIALMAKALIKMDPFPVWGDGLQTRNFTHVQDTVEGLLLLGADDRTVAYDCFNIGTSSHDTVRAFIETIFLTLDWHPEEMNYELDMPIGVGSRAADNKKMKSVFSWAPSTSLEHGVKRTLAWYQNQPDRPKSAQELQQLLMKR